MCLHENSNSRHRFLRRLYMSNNQINRIGRGSFKGISRVGTIDLAGNQLSTVETGMFADLRFIDTINLQDRLYF